MVATKDGDATRVTNLQSHQQADCLNGMEAAINVVAHEEIVGFRNVAADSEQFNQVVELAVNVSANGDWTLDRLDIGFVD